MEGLYYVEVQSGVSPLSNLGSVEKNWQRRATDLCVGEFEVFNYVAFDAKQPFSYNSSGGLVYDYYISKAYGYAICPTYSGSIADVNEAVNGQEMDESVSIALKDPLLSQNCDESILPLQKLEEAGVVLFKEKSYLQARDIFLCVYHKDKQELTQEETYKTLATIYELGLGVEKDMQQAMFWYQKSGLLPQ